MRKVSSAPSLATLGTQPENKQLPLAARVSKSGSTGSVSKLGSAGNGHKDGTKRQGSVPSRLRDCSTRVFPLAVVDAGLPTGPDPEVTQEFAESAKGLMGLDCFELYGPQPEAPSTRHRATDGALDDRLQNEAAFASCLATPVTAEEKNLGELVDAEARALLQAAQQGVESRYEREVSGGTGPASEVTASEEEVAIRRKRRMAEKFGSRVSRRREKFGDTSDLFEDCPDAQKMLSTLASLDDDRNQIKLDESYHCIGDVCFPEEEVDEAVFEWTAPHLEPSAALPISQSI